MAYSAGARASGSLPRVTIYDGLGGSSRSGSGENCCDSTSFGHPELLKEESVSFTDSGLGIVAQNRSLAGASQIKTRICGAVCEFTFQCKTEHILTCLLGT